MKSERLLKPGPTGIAATVACDTTLARLGQLSSAVIRARAIPLPQGSLLRPAFLAFLRDTWDGPIDASVVVPARRTRTPEYRFLEYCGAHCV
jgi:hypothetical protein